MPIQINRKYIKLLPVFHGPTAGYQAMLVEEYDDSEFCVEPITYVVRHGPFSDARLVARSRAIAWAKEIGYPYRDE